MSERRFNHCAETGVVGKRVRFYTPTSCEEQTVILTDDGRRYQAPTRLWKVAEEIVPVGYDKEENTENKLLSPLGEYVVAFAKNHDISISAAYEQPMVKARRMFFQRTGY